MGFPRYSLWRENRVRRWGLGEGCGVVMVGGTSGDARGQAENKTLSACREASCPSPAQTWVWSTGLVTPPKTVLREGVMERAETELTVR